MDRIVDDAVRRRALTRAEARGHDLAIEALTFGVVEIDPAVLEWEGSHGKVRAHRVFLVLPDALHAEVTASHSTRDVVGEVLAAAFAETPGEALADLVFERGDRNAAMRVERGSGGPYRSGA